MFSLPQLRADPAVCRGTHKMKKLPLPSPLRHDYRDHFFSPEYVIIIVCSIVPPYHHGYSVNNHKNVIIYIEVFSL